MSHWFPIDSIDSIVMLLFYLRLLLLNLSLGAKMLIHWYFPIDTPPSALPLKQLLCIHFSSVSSQFWRFFYIDDDRYFWLISRLITIDWRKPFVRPW
ncbi:hypothetical protein CEXT_431041 [Caerostris extrusa]|uniref:Uncharacterized protein n=1 Tax=Caerostris extrusa TaxID=172846 RepID=A0AAV4PRK5_CAEEX|nr:hypothetical protein CEXT_431041 [Caerostris extrusa]